LFALVVPMVLTGCRLLLAKRWKLDSSPLQLADQSEQLASIEEGQAKPAWRPWWFCLKR